jgi:hypothetical protein
MLYIKCPCCGAKSFPEESMFGEKVQCLVCKYEFLCEKTLAKPSNSQWLTCFLIGIALILAGLGIAYLLIVSAFSHYDWNICR